MTRFVTFEGIEGCGKTTQLRLASAWLPARRIPSPAPAHPGFGRGLHPRFIRTLNNFSALSLSPDRTLLFDLPVEAGLVRAEKRTAGVCAEAAEDRFER